MSLWELYFDKQQPAMGDRGVTEGAQKFFRAMQKYAGKQGTNGIKKLSGKGIKGYMYEVKIKGKNGAYRLLGNKTDSGEILWELFEKTH